MCKGLEAGKREPSGELQEVWNGWVRLQRRADYVVFVGPLRSFDLILQPVGLSWGVM